MSGRNTGSIECHKNRGGMMAKFTECRWTDISWRAGPRGSGHVS